MIWPQTLAMTWLGSLSITHEYLYFVVKFLSLKRKQQIKCTFNGQGDLREPQDFSTIVLFRRPLLSMMACYR